MTPRRLQGYTLIEMLVVIAIITTLAGLVLGAIGAVRRSSAEKSVQATLMILAAALERYENDFNDYPSSDGDLDGIKGAENLYQCLMTDQKEGPYIKATDVKTCDTNANGVPEIADFWGRPIRYLHHRDYQNQPPNRRTFRLMSAGPNGVPENGVVDSDDIVNWDKAKPNQQ